MMVSSPLCFCDNKNKQLLFIYTCYTHKRTYSWF